MQRIVLSFLLLIFLALPANAEKSFDKKLQNWGNELIQVERIIQSESQISKDDLQTIRQTLRQIKTEAKTQADNFNTEKLSQEKLLAALGPEPAKGELLDNRLETQRKKLKSLVVELDSRTKRANLILSRVQEALAALDNMEKNALRITLFGKADLSELSVDKVVAEWRSFYPTFNKWDRVASVVLILAILGYLQTKLPPVSQGFIDSLGYLNTKHLLYALMLLVCTFALRIRLFGVPNILHDVMSAIMALTLAVATFIAIRPLQFKNETTLDDDFRAEKKTDYTWMGNAMLFFMRAGLIAVVPCIMLGYVSLSVYLAFNITITLLTLLSFGVLRHAFLWLIRRLLGRKAHDSTMSIVIIEPLLALFLFMVSLSFWGVPPQNLEMWLDQYGDGIQVGKINLDFISIGSGIALFFVLYLLTRIIQWFFSERIFPTTHLDSGLRNAIHSLTGYVGVGIALLAGLGTLGLNVENLAIIVGALSVGIGFGLQAVTSNFISGLILLFERPIRVGDWIVIGQHQGTVKKIKVRSTEIETFQNASVIIPNSQLITDTVTNWMLHDRVARVDIKIGVSYDSDLPQVKELLLQSAEEHPEVRNKPRPFVLLDNFGDNALQVELRCFIKNASMMQGVASDLRIRILELFRKHNIEIPFPQRTIRVTSTDEKPVLLDPKIIVQGV